MSTTNQLSPDSPFIFSVGMAPHLLVCALVAIGIPAIYEDDGPSGDAVYIPLGILPNRATINIQVTHVECDVCVQIADTDGNVHLYESPLEGRKGHPVTLFKVISQIVMWWCKRETIVERHTKDEGVIEYDLMWMPYQIGLIAAPYREKYLEEEHDQVYRIIVRESQEFIGWMFYDEGCYTIKGAGIQFTDKLIAEPTRTPEESMTKLYQYLQMP